MRARDPGNWPVVVRSFGNQDACFDCPAAPFVCRILLGARHPYTRARSFDTPCFLTYDGSR
ncbi:hypothetical protein [Streptomyces sp. PanSC9]|uniref:hypothetical protein n=1 Tax=Streptomyces sp. PanSC9 TaxID=1520461 RepID=UPI000F49CA3F|nr:hypothetical protein [Streptomyces sp. PanSC9]ROP48056.1 hypothetical protein EDD94_7794 [Streptomyces sp. PanSC9]